MNEETATMLEAQGFSRCQERVEATKYRFGFTADLHLSSATPSSRKDDFPETMLGKLHQLRDFAGEYSLDAFIFGGDIWHKSSVPAYYVNQIMNTLHTFPCPLFTNLGNHDILFNRIDTLPRTPLGTLIAGRSLGWLGRIDVWGGDQHFLSIQSYDFEHGFVPRSDYPDRSVYPLSIALIHCFLGEDKSFTGTQKDYVTHEELLNSGFNWIFAGHDHVEEMKDQVFPDTGEVYHTLSPGSLSRGTKHMYNRVRDVCFYVVDCDFSRPINPIDQRIKVTRHPLEVEPAEDIYNEQKIAREDVSAKIAEFVNALRQSSSEKTSVYKTLREICPAGPHRAVCEHYLEAAGIVE